jgi:hypothetical protein
MSELRRILKDRRRMALLLVLPFLCLGLFLLERMGGELRGGLDYLKLEVSAYRENVPRFAAMTPAEAEAVLSDFLRDARLQAETRIIVSDGKPFIETIDAHSADAAATFIGLRAPEADESEAAYGAYLSALRFGVPNVPAPVFVLAAENIDFRRIFA